MKKSVSLLFCALSFLAAPAFAATVKDGCFQMYVPGSMYPVFCLSGTMEEGIGGAGVRLKIFGTNTNRVIACASSTAMRANGDAVEYVVNDVAELVLKNTITTGGRLEGDAVFGSTTLKFFELDEQSTRSLMNTYDEKGECKNLSAGEFWKLKK